MQLTLRQRATYLAHLHKAIFRSYHAQLLPYLARFIPADGTVIDVGAHAGQFTKIFARLAPQGQVYAFEPASYARSILRGVCAVRRLHNVTVVPAGLGAVAGRFDLDIPLKAKMEEVLTEIRSGQFAAEWSGEQASGTEMFERVRAVREQLPVSQWERRARTAFRIGDAAEG